MSHIEILFNAIVEGKMETAVEAVQNALSEGAKPQALLSERLIPAMQEIGNRFERGEAFVPELLMAARAMKGVMSIINPILTTNEKLLTGKIVIGTVYGDLHDIGKNLVASMFEGCGFEVINLGVNVPAQKFIDTAIEQKADIICLSALLTTTMEQMKVVIDALGKSGMRDRVKVMVGGAPVTALYAEQIGADAYSENANEAVKVAKQLMNI